LRAGHCKISRRIPRKRWDLGRKRENERKEEKRKRDKLRRRELEGNLSFQKLSSPSTTTFF